MRIDLIFLVEHVRMHTESLEELLAFLVLFLPVVYTKRALAFHESIEHLLVIVGDPLHVFFLRASVETQNFARCCKRDSV